MRKLAAVASGMMTFFLVTSGVSAKTLSELSSSLRKIQGVTQSFAEDDARNRMEHARESGNELFPAIEGMKPVLTVSQKNLLKRCDVMKVQTRRCVVLRCRLLEEGCKR